MGNVNRYDKPIQSEFINTYSPIPFDDMMKVGMLKRAEIEKGEQKAEAFMGQLQAIKVHSKDEPEYQERITKMQERLDETISKYGNLGTTEARREISKIVSEQSQDPWWRAAVHNYAEIVAGQEARKKALTEKGATPADVYNLDKAMESFQGTSARMKEDGTGMISLPGAFAPSDPTGFVGKQLDNMKPSGWSIDENTGDWIVTQGQEGIFADQIASTLGVKLSSTGTEIDPTTGKKINVYGVDMENSNVPEWFTNSAEGRRTQTEALAFVERAIEQDPSLAEVGDDLLEEKYKSLYGELVAKNIHERTFQKTNFKLTANPFAVAAYKAKLKEQEPAIRSTVLVGTLGSTVKGYDDVNVVKAGYVNNINEIRARKESYISANGITEEKDADGNVVSWKDSSGADRTSDLLKYNMEIQQQQRNIGSLDDYLNTVLTELKFTRDDLEGSSAKIEQEVEARYAEYLKTLTSEQRIWGASRQERSSVPVGDDDGGVGRKELYRQEARRKDPVFKQVDAALKRNAENSAVEVGVSRFNTASTNTAMERIFNDFVVEGEDNRIGKLGGGMISVFYADTNQNVEDPEALSKLSSEKEARFAGYFYHPQRGLCLMYRPYNTDGSLGRHVAMTAPEGVLEHLVTNGEIDAAKYAVSEQFNSALKNLNRKSEGSVNIDKEGRFEVFTDSVHNYPVKIRQKFNTTAAFAPSSGEGVELTFQTNEGEEVISFGNVSSAVDFYLSKLSEQLQQKK